MPVPAQAYWFVRHLVETHLSVLARPEAAAARGPPKRRLDASPAAAAAKRARGDGDSSPTSSASTSSSPTASPSSPVAEELSPRQGGRVGVHDGRRQLLPEVRGSLTRLGFGISMLPS